MSETDPSQPGRGGVGNPMNGLPAGVPAQPIPQPGQPEYGQVPYGQPGYPYPTAAPNYGANSYPQANYGQLGVSPQPGYGYPTAQPGYPQPGYPQQGVPQQGYAPPNYPQQPGYAQPGYAQPGYPQQQYPVGYPQQGAHPQYPQQSALAGYPASYPQQPAPPGIGAAPIPLSAFQSVSPQTPVPLSTVPSTAAPQAPVPQAVPQGPAIPQRPVPTTGAATASGATSPAALRPTPLRPVPAGNRPQPIATSSQATPAAASPNTPVPLRPQPIGSPTPPARPATPTTASTAQVAAPTATKATAATIPAAALGPIQVHETVAPVVDPERTENEDEADPSKKVVKAAPPWMISMLVHMVAIIVLALLYIVTPAKNQVEIEVVYAEKLGEQVLDDTLQSPESLNMEIEDPALAFDAKPVEDPFAAPPMVEMMELDATNATDSIEAPSIGLALSGREAGSKKALLAAYGGNATTEASVRLGLEWLKRNQMNDGSWSLSGPYADGTTVDNKVSATAMALLAFQGAGHTHKTGDFQKEVAKGWKALTAMQNADGFFQCESANHHRLYAQAQATIAACEIYGMTKDPAFKSIAQKALDFAHKAQAPEGGWRYEPQIDSDTSVTGWYMMALQSGRMAGLEVQSPIVDKINKFLDSASHENGSRYSYKPGMEQTLTMTAEGLLCRQYLGWKHDDPRMRAGVEYVLANLIDYNDQNVYYWYYATQAAHHMDGDDWNRWNAVMRQEVPENQVKTGAERGSWASSGDRWGPHGGRLYVTCLSIYMLEVYYRHLPIYKYRLQ